jgi:hypothetical protein
MQDVITFSFTSKELYGQKPLPLSMGDRISLHLADIDVSADLASSIIEDGFDVKSTARSIVDIYQYRTRRRQNIVSQKIDVPEFRANVRNVNLNDGHPCVIGKLDPPIQGRGRRPGSGL